MKNKKGFTLVELLAVIAILAILVILALPNVIRLYTEARKNAFVNEARTIYKETTNKFINESVKGNKVNAISSKDNTKLDMTGEGLDYCVILDNKGKVKKLAVGNGSYYIKLSDVGDVESITKEDVQEGKLDDMNCDASAFKPKLNCKFDGEMVQGAEYVNGQYTYRYKQEPWYSGWIKTSSDGWGVRLTNKNSTDPVTTELCTTINDKPIVSMMLMFSESRATSVDLSSFDTSNVTNMERMFYNLPASTLDLSTFDTSNVTNMDSMFLNTKATTINISSFNTSKVTDMSDMFWGSKVESIDLSNFDTSNVTDMHNMLGDTYNLKQLNLGKLNTSNVTNMASMFSSSKATSLDLSSFDTSNVTNMGSMFSSSYATEIKGLEKFKTSNVVNMSSMFAGSYAKKLDLSNFDTSKVTDMSSMFASTTITNLDLSNFDTSKVTDMSNMFSYTGYASLDLSAFDTSNVTNMERMFYNAKATTGYAKTQADADKFNSSSNKPSGLTFTVK